MAHVDFPIWFGLGSYGGLIICLFAGAAIAAHALVRKRGTSRQLAHSVLVCLAAACFSFVPIWWNQNRLDLYGPSLSPREVMLFLMWTVLCGWVAPLGVLVGYTVLAKPQPAGAFMGLGLATTRNAQPSPLDDPARQFEPLGANRAWGQLITLEDGDAGQAIALTRQLTLLGREIDNDVVIDDERTSRHHAELRWDGQRAHVLDRGSMNGVFVNRQPARGVTRLSDGDIIQLGARRYRIELLPLSAGGSSETDPDAETHKMAGARRTPPPLSPGALVLVSSGGPTKGQRWEITDAQVTIGRDPERPICLPVASVSRLHAQVIRQQTGYYLTDMQSSNGVLVNDEQLAEPRLLRTGDIIRIGEVTLVCEASGEALPASPPTHPLADATIAFARSGFDATTLTSDIQPRLPAPTPATEQLSGGER